MIRRFNRNTSSLIRRVILGAALLVSLAVPHGAVSAPITSNSALPVSEKGLIFRALLKYSRSTGDPSPMDRELTVWAAPTVLAYGVSEKFSLFGVIPYLDKSLDVATPAGRLTRGDSGIGDLRAFARYTIGQWDRQGETLRLAPFVGLEVPTGDDDHGDSLGLLPPMLQLGSGSWDPFIGTVFSWQTLGWQIDTSASYKFNTQANGFEFGDEVRMDFSFQYRLWPRKLGKGVPGFLYGVVETNLLWRDQNKAVGGNDPNSGGTTWYLAPGIQYVTKQWVLEAAVQLPVVQSLNGSGLENDFIVTSGFRIRF